MKEKEDIIENGEIRLKTVPVKTIADLQCPFDKNLKCEDCRLYKVYSWGKGERLCSLIIHASELVKLSLLVTRRD